jgi:hypothetical protein
MWHPKDLVQTGVLRLKPRLGQYLRKKKAGTQMGYLALCELFSRGSKSLLAEAYVARTVQRFC